MNISRNRIPVRQIKFNGLRFNNIGNFCDRLIGSFRSKKFCIIIILIYMNRVQFLRTTIRIHTKPNVIILITIDEIIEEKPRFIVKNNYITSRNRK